MIAAISAQGDIPKGTPVQVSEWFWRSSQFYLHLKRIARTIPGVCVLERQKQGPKCMIYDRVYTCRHPFYFTDCSSSLLA